MKNVLDFILENYSTENEFKNNNIANYLRAIAKETIEKDVVIDINKYKVEGSPGKGRQCATFSVKLEILKIHFL